MHHLDADASWRRHQRVLNESWPPDAATIPDRPAIRVEVRIEWAVDGEQWHRGGATRWTSRHVFVTVGDPRLATMGVWVAPSDVRRL